MRTLAAVLGLSRAQIGTVESPLGSNSQPYGVWFGFNRVPWCAIFVSWVMAMCGLADQFRFASVAAALAWARQNGRHTTSFKAGYIACYLSGGPWSPGHTGIIEAVHSDGTVTTIEGNTYSGNAGDQREGIGVYRRRRPKSFWNNGCIRIDYNPPLPQGEEDEMKPRLVRAPTGAVYAFDGVTLRPANNVHYQNVIRWYSGQKEPWDNWSQEQIDAFPQEEGAPES